LHGIEPLFAVVLQEGGIESVAMRMRVLLSISHLVAQRFSHRDSSFSFFLFGNKEVSQNVLLNSDFLD
jgi:hypothetical protein